jgi:rhodanese-related sulfurtransferase
MVFTGCSTAQEEKITAPKTNTQVEKNDTKGIDFENAVFVDVRTPKEYETGTFNNAVNIPLNELESKMDKLSKSKQIVVFCRSGSRASRAMQILSENGFNNVVNGINTAQLKSLQQN